MKPDEFFQGFIKNLRLGKADIKSGSEDNGIGDFEEVVRSQTVSPATEEDANLVTSKYKGEGIETHALFIDLDVPHIYVPSSTEGHGHLLVDVKLTKTEWLKAMNALETAGLIGRGYKWASLDRGFASLRLPWIKKENV